MKSVLGRARSEKAFKKSRAYMVGKGGELLLVKSENGSGFEATWWWSVVGG